MAISWQARIVNWQLKRLRNWDHSLETFKLQRERAVFKDNKFKKRSLDLSHFDQYSVHGINVDRYRPSVTTEQPIANRTVLLLLHGGAFCHHYPNVFRGLLADLCDQIVCDGVVPDYRLAPEHPFPAALDDCYSCYQDLIEQGYRPENIIMYGDSAGGGLALSTMQTLKANGEPLPRALTLSSPSVDMTMQLPSYYLNEDKDVMLRAASLLFYRRCYLNGHDVFDTRVSPLLGDLADLPPMKMIGDANELQIDSIKLLAELVQKAGGSADLTVTTGLPHDFLVFDILPEAKQARSDVAAFFRSALGR